LFDFALSYLEIGGQRCGHEERDSVVRTAMVDRDGSRGGGLGCRHDTRADRMALSDEEWRLAEALAILKQHGDTAARHVADQSISEQAGDWIWAERADWQVSEKEQRMLSFAHPAL
jgi:hypothetical protein